VAHGKLTVNVPRDMFRGDGALIDEKKAAPFKKMLQSRYPWLSDNSLEVLMSNARSVMLGILDEESNGRSFSRVLASEGRLDEAIDHLKEHLDRNSNDADTWYALGELLCKTGKVEEGYKAFARGRELF